MSTSIRKFSAHTITFILYSFLILFASVTDDFQEIHRCLQEAAQPFLSLLKQGGHIPHNRDITAFTPDVTRFILKQHEKSRSDSPAQSMCLSRDVRLDGLLLGLSLLCTVYAVLIHMWELNVGILFKS